MPSSVAPPSGHPGTIRNLVETDVLIVGAGPTGLALALKLHQSGIRPLVVDRLASGLNTSRAAVIHAHTLEVLNELGVASALLANGLKLDRFSIRDRDRTLLRLRFDTLPTPVPHLLMLPQDVTERLLHEALVAAGGTVQRGCTVTELTNTPEGVIATIQTEQGRWWIRSRYVVGADGLHSIVREAAGIGFTGHNYEESFVLADVRLSGPAVRMRVNLRNPGVIERNFFVFCGRSERGR